LGLDSDPAVKQTVGFFKGLNALHELGITQSLVEIAENTARSNGAEKVLSVSVSVGELAGVVPEAMEFAFDVVTRGTLLEGARLLIRRVPGRGRCCACGAESAMGRYTFTCPACGEPTLERLQGDELKITELEIE